MGLEENGIVKNLDTTTPEEETAPSHENLNEDEINGEITELPTKKYNETLHKIVEDQLSVPFGDCIVEITPGSSKGDNYLGIVYRCVATSPNGDKLTIIAKLPPQCVARRESFCVRDVFVRESLFYEELYPMYLKFQEEKGIDVKVDGFHEVPLCYESITEEPNEALFLEDLKAAGYEMFDRLKTITADQVNLVMKTLAKMHATAFAIKDQQPEKLEKFMNMPEIFLMRDMKSRAGINMWFDTLKKQSLACLDNHENEALKKRGNEVFQDDFFSQLEKYTSGDAAEPYAIPTHGDCWNNNMMFRYNQDGIAEGIRLLDFQIMRYSSPILDLAYYIFCCTGKELRDAHFQDFLDVYYNTLSSHMRRLGSNPEVVFPREAFDSHWKLFGGFGLTMASCVLPMFTSTVDEIPDMDEVAEKFKEAEDSGETLDESIIDFSKNKSIGVYNKRMTGVYEDMFNLGFI